ncbi:hypothetical protein [Thioclava atlantica]|uniref:Uncharacterized protein n=1 Tax=Thioclava atlantica TaxID=1317124 RepID=A0A085TTQ8_9RHOB|nr:hypothetical protein [Thioclava atlantica]KFE34105.1 hypothetical protein DW2_13930 [Thioclava atlantica]
MEPTTSSVIEARLRNEAQEFAQPERRIATIDRLTVACSAIARGELVRAQDGSQNRHDPRLLRITAQNIAAYAKRQGWSGPTRTFLSNRSNGLIEYIRARENERAAVGAEQKRKPKTQYESLLDQIEDIETRQFFRHQLELRKKIEQELNMIKNGLKRIPQIDLQTLLLAARKPGTDRTFLHSDMSNGDIAEEHLSSIQSMLNRFDDIDRLRHLGLKMDQGDILSFSNSLVVSKSELDALRSILGRSDN